MRRRLDTGVQLGEVILEVRPASVRFGNHRLEPIDLRPQGADLAVDAAHRIFEDRPSFGLIGRRTKAAPVADPGEIILEELTDLREAEAGVVAESLDEPQPLEIVRVVKPVSAATSWMRRRSGSMVGGASRWLTPRL
jgi:hypothetical protein